MSKVNKEPETAFEDNAEIVDTKRPVAQIVFIVASFSLAILDMIFLYGAFQTIVPHLGRAGAMGVALLLATAANFTALVWGYENGKNLSKKSINKESRGYFIAWAIMGLVYASVRIGALINKLNNNIDVNIATELLQMVILAISYIGTGTLISSSAAKIFNRKRSDVRKFEKRFNLLHEELIAESAEIQRLTKILENYQETCASLDSQRDITKKRILRAEKASMGSVVGKIIEKNPGISPKLVMQARDEYLEKRRNEDDSENL